MTRQERKQRNEEIRQCIQNHPDWSMAMVADYCNMSETWLCTLIRRHPEWDYQNKSPKHKRNPGWQKLLQSKQKANTQKPPKNDIERLAHEARERGMSYGQYCAALAREARI